MPVLVAFDIGIKNLAFCVMRRDASNQEVLALENYNLLASETVAATVCGSCKSKATYESSLGPSCKRHIPKTHPILQEDGKDVSKMPGMPVLKGVAKPLGLKGKTKDELVAVLKTRHSLPLLKVKAPNAAKQTLVALHDALRQMVTDRWSVFSQCTEILLENQPALKNPHMKTVQVLLFAALRERFLSVAHATPIPNFHLIHAKKKATVDADAKPIAKGDEGYAARKHASEERLHEWIKANTIKDSGTLFPSWLEAKKQSDMSDAVCMCMDFTI
jgi:hypothetical protein